MSYQEKLAQAKEIIREYNSADPERQIDVEGFVKKLREIGGTSEASLQACSYEDLEAIGLPRILARRVALVFRAKAKEDGSEQAVLVTEESQVRKMTISELLGKYDPKEPDNFVGKRLSEMARGKRCLVFNDDGTTVHVHIKASMRLLEEIRNNYPERDFYEVDGQTHETYRIGERPFQIAEENPLYRGRPLSPSGVCDRTNRDWSGVLHEVRVFIYLGVHDTREIRFNPDSLDDAHRILDMVIGKSDAMQSLQSRYPKTSVQYKKLAEVGKLPSLKIRLTQGSTSLVRPNNPFPDEHKKEY